MAMKKPPHPGLLIREDVIALLGLSLVDAVTKFEVDANCLSAVIEGREPVSAVLPVNLEKAGISMARAWIAMQQAFDWEKKPWINQTKMIRWSRFLSHRRSRLK